MRRLLTTIRAVRPKIPREYGARPLGPQSVSLVICVRVGAQLASENTRTPCPGRNVALQERCELIRSRR